MLIVRFSFRLFLHHRHQRRRHRITLTFTSLPSPRSGRCQGWAEPLQKHVAQLPVGGVVLWKKAEFKEEPHGGPRPIGVQRVGWPSLGQSDFPDCVRGGPLEEGGVRGGATRRPSTNWRAVGGVTATQPIRARDRRKGGRVTSPRPRANQGAFRPFWPVREMKSDFACQNKPVREGGS